MRETQPAPAPHARRFRLDVAGFVAEIELPDGAWAAALSDRYADFLSAAAPAWQILIAHERASYEAVAPWIRHDGPRTHYGFHGSAGVIDLEARCVTVQVREMELAASALERSMVYAMMQELPRSYDGLLIHGVGVVLDAQAGGCLFAGHSGAGKSTVARLAQGVGQVLSDENMVLRLREHSGAELYSTPFWGQSTPPERVHRVNSHVPLAAIYMLTHTPDFELTRLRAAEAVSALLSTEKVATERIDSATAWLRVAGRLAAAAPIYRLGFRPTTGLWEFLASSTP